MGFIKYVKNIFDKQSNQSNQSNQSKEPASKRNRLFKPAPSKKTNGDGGRREGSGVRKLWLKGNRVMVTNDGEIDISVDGMTITPGGSVELNVALYKDQTETNVGPQPLSATLCINAQLCFEDFRQSVQGMMRIEMIELISEMEKRLMGLY